MMINTNSQLLYQLDILNKQNEYVSNQMSTGKQIQKGSEDSSLYHNILNFEKEISSYSNIETHINQSLTENSIADISVSEIKTQMESIITEVIKSLNSGIDASSMEAVSLNIESMKDTIFSLVNTTANDKYVFAGVESNTQPFVENTNGIIEYQNSDNYQNVLVNKGMYSEQGVNGFDIMYYTSSSATNSENLSFSENDVILDSDGNKWEFIDYDNDGVINKDIVFKNADSSGDFMHVSASGTPITYTLTNTQDNTIEAKSNYFSLVNEVINALNYKNSDGNAITEDESNDILRGSLDKLNSAFDSTNVAHSKLGSKNQSLENYLSSTSTMITNLKIFYEESASADLTDAAVKAQSLETTYAALYSTISKVNSLSLVNYL